MIDVHILNRPSVDNARWLAECLSSLRLQMGINVAIYSGMLYNTRDARRRAYAEAKSEFVAYVDPDDMVTPGIFEELVKAVDDAAVGAYAWTAPMTATGLVRAALHPHVQWTIDAQAAARPLLFSGGAIVRRRVMQDVCRAYWPIIPKVWGQDRCLFLLCALAGPFRQVPRLGYLWRQHGHSTSATHLKRGVDFNDRLRPTIDEIERVLDRRLLSWAEVVQRQRRPRCTP